MACIEVFAGARIEQRNVQRAEPLANLLPRSEDGLMVADIQRQRVGVVMAIAQFVQRLFITSAQDDAMALLNQLLGQRFTNAGRRAG